MRRIAAGLLLVVLILLLPAVPALPQPGPIWLVREVTAGPAASGPILASQSPAALETPIPPGSILKIATIAAALESGVITPASGVTCSRKVEVAGHSLTCSHPDLHRPVRAVDALAQSCNVYAATIASRLSRSALDKILVDLGLPVTMTDLDMALAETFDEVFGAEAIRSVA